MSSEKFTTRQKIMRAMKAAGASNDKQAFTRLYIENRISLQAANEAWREGRKLAAFVEKRDATGISS